jgi:hypothetical protein
MSRFSASAHTPIKQNTDNGDHQVNECYQLRSIRAHLRHICGCNRVQNVDNTRQDTHATGPMHATPGSISSPVRTSTETPISAPAPVVLGQVPAPAAQDPVKQDPPPVSAAEGWRGVYNEFRTRDDNMAKEYREEIDTFLVVVCFSPLPTDNSY